jgi:hypothetical protein
MVDPMTVISTISAGLNLVDKFTEVVRKLRRKEAKPHSVQATQEAGDLVIRRDGAVAEKVSSGSIHLNEWDATRYQALESKVKSLWNQFNALDAQLPTLAVDEKVRIEQKMETMRKELCGSFKQMINIYEKTLGTSLGDHYSLYQTCSDS